MDSAPTHEPTSQHFASPLTRYLAATRPAFLSVTLVGCLLGLVTAHADGIALDPVRAVLTVLLALIAHAGGNVINDYHDAINGTDDANTDRLYPFTGGSRFIQNGVFTPRRTAVFGYGLLAAVVPVGLWLSVASGPELIAIGLAGLLLGWAYSAPPLQLVARGLGEVVIVACWLLVVLGTDYVQRGQLDWTPVAAGLSYALLIANLLYINQFPDRAADALAGKHTLVVRLGPDIARWGYCVIAILAYGWLLYAIGRGDLPLASAVAASTGVFSLIALRGLIRHAGQPERLAPAIKLTIVAATLHGLLLSAALGFG